MRRPDPRWLAAGALGAAIAVCTVGPRLQPEARRPAAVGPAMPAPVAARERSTPLPALVDRQLSVWLPQDPSQILSADCFDHTWGAGGFSPLHPDSAVAHVASWVERYAAVEVLPWALRRSIDDAGLGPTRFAWLAEADPWLGYAALRLEDRWGTAEWFDIAHDEARQRGVSWEHLVVTDDPALRDRLERENGPRRDLLRAHAMALAASDVPEVRDRAVVHWASTLTPGAPTVPLAALADALSDHTAAALLSGHCRETAGLAPADRAALLRRAAETDDAIFAVNATLVGLRDAHDAGDDLAPWLELLDETWATCDRWGPRADLARHPALQSFDGLPEAARPEGFPAAVARFAAAARVHVEEVDCSAPPCLAWLTDPLWRSLDAQAAAVWGPRGAVERSRSQGDGWRRFILVSFADDLPDELRDDIVAALGSYYTRTCMDADTLGAVRVEYGAAPRTWEEALQAALFACHREEPLTEPWSGLARWDGAWAFDPTLPSSTASPPPSSPAPTAPLTVGLSLGLR
ncbi:MAG: hypothetical protein R3F59_10905 [Myxococcota bacterium]